MTLSKYLKESVSGRTWEEAKQLYELQDQGLNDEEICRQANISERDLQRSRGAMALAEQYQDSEYGDQFSDNHYIIFHDLLRFNTFKEIREWLGWSDEKLKALDEKNTAIFFSLLSRLPDLSEEGEYIEPAIKTQDDLIYFILIIKSAMAMDFLLETHDIKHASDLTPEGQQAHKEQCDKLIYEINRHLEQRKSTEDKVTNNGIIELMRLQGFKSIANATLMGVTPFAVLAGSNGSGKSNFADGLAFFSTVVTQGAKQAIRQFGGFNQIHCFKFKKDKARTVSLELKIQLDYLYHYTVKIYQIDTSPQLEERLTIGGEIWLSRERGKPPSLMNIKRIKPFRKLSDLIPLPAYPDDLSGLMLLSDLSIHAFMTNIRVFRFDPLGAKEPDTLSADASELDTHGRNVATILSVLEKKTELREQILEWIELLVPGMEKVKTEQQKLDGRTIIKFKEEGMKAFLPANLISDGTIYALCILTAVLSRAKGQGMTIIEEPERGIHPQAIAELVSLMRANASPEHPVWVTTHSESVVRSATPDELWLVNKLEGKTELKNAGRNSVPLGNMNLDKAWLMNFFDGGLPW